MRLEPDLQQRCVAAGLDVAEMDRLFTESRSIGPVLARIGKAEAEQYVRDSDRARQAQDEASRRTGVGTRRWRSEPGPSVVLSIRLDHDEIDELRRRAGDRNLGASVLARSYIRQGLARPVSLPPG